MKKGKKNRVYIHYWRGNSNSFSRKVIKLKREI